MVYCIPLTVQATVHTFPADGATAACLGCHAPVHVCQPDPQGPELIQSCLDCGALWILDPVDALAVQLDLRSLLSLARGRLEGLSRARWDEDDSEAVTEDRQVA